MVIKEKVKAPVPDEESKTARQNELAKLTPEDIIEKARNKGFAGGRERDEEVELAQLQLLLEIRNALKAK